MKRIIAMMMVLGMMLSMGACAFAEGLDIDTSIEADFEAVVEDTGVPTYNEIVTLWKEAEEAYYNENWEEAVLKYLECASKSYVMENALLAPVSAIGRAKDASKYVQSGSEYDKNINFWKEMTDWMTEANGSSYCSMANACEQLIAICELKAGVCYYKLGENKLALTCMTSGFSGLMLGRTVSGFSDDRIDIDTLYMTEFMPVYNELLGLSEVFTFE